MSLILRVLVILGGLFSLGMGVVGCAGGAGSGSAKVLRVGVTPNEPPIVYKEGGQVAGWEAEFARKLAARLGLGVKFVEMPFDRLLPALDAGKIDIVMSGMTVTALRTPLAQFCDPYATTGLAVMVRSADLWTYSYPEVIYVIKSRLGVEKGTIAEVLAQRRCPKATVSTFASSQAAVQALKANQVDAVIADAPVLWRLAAQSESGALTVVPRSLTEENLAWAVRRGDDDLLNAANAALRQWSADGTLSTTLSAYAPGRAGLNFLLRAPGTPTTFLGPCPVP